MFAVLLGCAQTVPPDTVPSSDQAEAATAEEARDTTTRAKISYHFTTCEPDDQPPVIVTEESITVITEMPVHEDLIGFSEFLDREHFLHSLSQAEFVDVTNRYTYEGKTILKTNGGFCWDGVEGGGLMAHGDLFGFENRAEITTYLNEMCTKVALDGLTLPFEIAFSDTLSTVLEKIGLDAISDVINGDQTDLVSNASSSLVFSRTDYEDAVAASRGQYELIYTENYRIIRGDGRHAAVTRQIFFGFDADKTLCYLQITVFEKYGESF